VVAVVTAEREAGLISPRLCSRKTREESDRLEEAVEIREEEDRRRENMAREKSRGGKGSES